MLRVYQLSAVLFFLLLTNVVKAETMVLIHGYLGDNTSWRKDALPQSLLKTGWIDGGNYSLLRQGVLTPSAQNLHHKGRVFYTVDLPYDAAIEQQVMVLGTYLYHLYLQRKEPMILVGHSVGGIVARAYITMKNTEPVKALISIATPHLGTPVAKLSKIVAKTPLNIASRMIGAKNLKQSLPLFFDIREESQEKGGYLYWLNHHHHPAIRYFSIVRDNKSLRKFDFIVPPFSQDMNNVWALKGQSMVIVSKGNHFLNQRDMKAIARITQKLTTKLD